MTVAEKKPSEIARDTLKLLLTRKLAPTPANFRTVYHEVAGTPDAPPFPADSLRHIIQALPLRTPAQQRARAARQRHRSTKLVRSAARPGRLRQRQRNRGAGRQCGARGARRWAERGISRTAGAPD